MTRQRILHLTHFVYMFLSGHEKIQTSMSILWKKQTNKKSFRNITIVTVFIYLFLFILLFMCDVIWNVHLFIFSVTLIMQVLLYSDSTVHFVIKIVQRQVYKYNFCRIILFRQNRMNLCII